VGVGETAMIEEIRKQLSEAEERIDEIIRTIGLPITGIRLETEDGIYLKVKLEVNI
jgi:hypothetical protein